MIGSPAITQLLLYKSPIYRTVSMSYANTHENYEISLSIISANFDSFLKRLNRYWRTMSPLDIFSGTLVTSNSKIGPLVEAFELIVRLACTTSIRNVGMLSYSSIISGMKELLNTKKAPLLSNLRHVSLNRI